MLQQLSVIALPVILSAAVALAPLRSAPEIAQPDGRFSALEAHYRASNASIGAFPELEPQTRTTRFVVASVGNEARYRVREQLARVDFPSDAIGKTNQVEGAIVIGADGKIVREGSSFTVDLTSIQSDNQRRDGFIRRNTLKTDSFPKAVFVPTSARGLPATLPATGEMAFELMGDLTIHGVTKPATWQVKAARSASGAVTGSATTNFKFGDYGMTIPKVGMVLSVDDSITLEYDFNLLPEAPPK